MTDHDVAETMMRMGGSFMQQLGTLYMVADPENQRRLMAAFADEWTKYHALTRLRLEREAR